MKKIQILIGLAVVIILAGAVIWYASNGLVANRTKSPAADSGAPLSPLPVLSSSSSPSLITQADYVCNGGRTINAAFYRGEAKPAVPGQPPIPAGSVKIILSDGRNFVLPQTISADGARYANGDESFIFWSKGDGAIVLENNVEKDYTGCVVSNQAAGLK